MFEFLDGFRVDAAITGGRTIKVMSAEPLTDIRAEKYFQNIIKSTRNQIVFTIFRLIWIQTDIRFDKNQSQNGKFNLISGWFNKISKRFLCVYAWL